MLFMAQSPPKAGHSPGGPQSMVNPISVMGIYVLRSNLGLYFIVKTRQAHFIVGAP